MSVTIVNVPKVAENVDRKETDWILTKDIMRCPV